jgi:hypothetical protein
MIAHRENHSLQVVCWYFYGDTNSDGDFQQYIDTFAMVRPETPVRPCALLYVEPNNPMPNATWRRKMAEASKDFASRPFVVFASPSTIVRTIVTGVNWLRPPEYDFQICSTFAEGLEWLDEQRPGVRVILSDLFDACVAEAGTKRPA